MLQGQRGHIVTSPKQQGKPEVKRHYTGQRNRWDQIYTIRNVNFEPFSKPNLDWVNKTLFEIENAFKWKSPAIISTHRVNYVSGMNKKNRDKNLKQLKDLIQSVLNKWPDVTFCSSDELLSYFND